ncbi:hypothetical protein B0T20DRAFT_466874 [Sordaria brevicollis]|uniref:DUF7730 domain-containing protein n=1 Tax=Sordaria brevicollis TaxID=83679 RepID=A0AAE0PL56_SORBR|nr:hypothetical protein B0T20DRAFT_466874 [Sordaria brevicollis]
MDERTPPPTVNGGEQNPGPNRPCTKEQCVRSRGILQGLNDTLQGEKAAAQREATGLRRECAGLRQQITRLEAQIERLRIGSEKHTQRTWREMLRQHLETGQPSWEQVWKQCSKEENMSARVNWVHPSIKFVQPGDAEEHEEERPAPGDNRHFNFNGLPAEIQARIFRLWLFKEGKLIHVISRLDPFVPVEEFPEEADLQKRSGLKHTFFIGDRRCNITHSGHPPNQLLRVLLVCKKFYFIGIHCFYGLNTFAFSSLGEFHRFCQGIGPARFERLQHLEITLIGNQYLTVPLDEKGRIPYSRRTFPLSFLPDCHRIKTLVIHVDESSKGSERRSYENRALKEFMYQKTAGQPNQRKLRALRTIQGMDYIYQLRGLERIRFYDLYKAVFAGRDVREPVADWSFVEDVTNTATMQKVASRRESSKLEKLTSLFGDNEQQQQQEGAWSPERDDWRLVKSFYTGYGGSYDQMRHGGDDDDADDADDVPSRMSASSGPRQEQGDDSDSEGSSSASSSSSGSGSSSSSSGDGGPPPQSGPAGPAATKGQATKGKAPATATATATATARRGQPTASGTRGNATRAPRAGPEIRGPRRGGPFANVNPNPARSNPTPSPSPSPTESDTSTPSSDSSSDSDGVGAMAMSVIGGGSIADAIDPDSDNDLPQPAGSVAGSILIELLSDDESNEEEDLFVGQRQHNPNNNSNRSNSGRSSSRGDAEATPMLIDDDEDDLQSNSSTRPSQPPPSVVSAPARMHSLTPMSGFGMNNNRGNSVPAYMPAFLSPAPRSEAGGSRSSSVLSRNIGGSRSVSERPSSEGGGGGGGMGGAGGVGRGSSPSFAALLNIQPASSASGGARYLPPNNAAARESMSAATAAAAAGMAAVRRMRESMSMSRSMSRSVSRGVSVSRSDSRPPPSRQVSRSVSRPISRSGSIPASRMGSLAPSRSGSVASAIRGVNGNGDRSGSRSGSPAGMASSFAHGYAHLTSAHPGSSLGRSGSSSSEMFVRQTQMLRLSPGGARRSESIDLTGDDEDGNNGSGGNGVDGSGGGNGGLMTIDEGDENGNGNGDGEDSDIEMVDLA